MSGEEALVIVDTLLYPEHLTQAQELVFRGALGRADLSRNCRNHRL